MRGLVLLRQLLCLDTAALGIGFCLDMIAGDPLGRWHPVCWIGRLVAALELRLCRPQESLERQRRKGRLTVVCVLLVTALVTGALLYGGVALAGSSGWGWCYLILASLLADTALAVRGLWQESMRVYRALPSKAEADKTKKARIVEQSTAPEQGAGKRAKQSAASEQSVSPERDAGKHAEQDTDAALVPARQALSRIVGRDTEALTEAGILRATVETVAENTTDGIVAPLFYLTLGGAVLGLLYKAINTMDSMLGYRSERYLHYGRAAARLDDAAGYLPARLAALLWIAASALCGEDARGAWRIWRRDRRAHESPNSAQTESACAGSLGIELAGDAVYFGKKKKKPTIGDDLRPIEREDIRRTDRMMAVSALLALLLAVGLRAAAYLLIGVWL